MSSSDRRAHLLYSLLDRCEAHRIAILAWAVLPNHYHILVEVREWTAVGKALRAVHGPLARLWNQGDGTPGRGVWYQYADRAIRSEAHYFTTLNYIHYNPVKHEWARSPEEWEESSVHGYLETVGRDWLRKVWTDYPLKDYGSGWDDDVASKTEGSAGSRARCSP